MTEHPENAPGFWKRLGGQMRAHFITGVLVVTPVVLAAWILYQLLAWVDGLLWDRVRLGWIRPGGVPGVGFAIVVVFIFLAGMTVNNYVGRRFYTVVDRVLARIPLFDKIYVALRQIGDAILSRENSVFRAVGMIEFPRKGVWSLVFISDSPGHEIQDVAGEAVRSVFLPTSPNPTTGYLLMVPEREIRRLSLSVEEGLKMVISGGAYVPHRDAVAGARPVRLKGFPRSGDAEPGE